MSIFHWTRLDRPHRAAAGAFDSADEFTLRFVFASAKTAPFSWKLFLLISPSIRKAVA
jgi:hypothetical protein